MCRIPVHKRAMDRVGDVAEHTDRGRHLALGLGLGLALLLILLVPMASTRARPDVSGVELELVGRLGGQNGGVFVRGTYAYATFGQGLDVLDVSDPTHPQRVGGLVLDGFAWAVDVAGDYAYVTNYHGGTGGEGLIVVDVSDPACPVKVAAGQTSVGDVRAIHVVGDYAYLVHDRAGISIVDISDPLYPVEASFYDTQGGARDIFVAGETAYVTNDDEGLAIVDVSNPISPTLVTSLTLPAPTRGVYVAGQHAYVTAHPSESPTHNLYVVDVSDPAQPSVAGSAPVLHGFPGTVKGVYAAGDYVYVAGSAYLIGGRWDGGLEVVDVSDPANPQRMGDYLSPQVEETYDVYVASGHAYLTGYGDGLLVIDVSNPDEPAQASHYQVPTGAGSLAVSGDTVYLADGWHGFKTIDVAERTNPVIVGAIGPSVEKNSAAMELDLVAPYAYVADYGGGLRVLDVSDPANPQEAGFYPLPDGQDWARRVHVAGETAYVADYYGYRLRVFDVSDPSNPTPINTFEGTGETGFILDVYVAGDYAYTSGNGLRVLDVSDPLQIEEKGVCPNVVGGNALQVVGDWAYVLGGDNKFWIVDVSNPLAPAAVSTYTLPAYFPAAVWVTDHPATGARLAYVGTTYNGVWVLDVSDPANPTGVGSFNTGGALHDVYAEGNDVYLANGVEGLYVLAHLTLQATPSSLTWLGAVDGPDPRPHTVHVESSGRSLTWTAALSPTVDWMVVAPLSGTTPAAITATAHISGLGPGWYRTQLVVRSEEGVVGSPQTIPLTLIMVENVYGLYLPLVLRNGAP